MGFTGPLLRGSGIPWDLRKAQPYDCYADMKVKPARGTENFVKFQKGTLPANSQGFFLSTLVMFSSNVHV